MEQLNTNPIPNESPSSPEAEDEYFMSSSSDGSGEYQEDIDTQIEYLSEKRELLLRATRFLKEEEAYNASVVYDLILAEKRLQEEDPHHEADESESDTELTTTTTTTSTPKDGPGSGENSDNIWKQAKEVIDILNQRTDVGGRPPIYRKDKSKRRKVRFDDEHPESVQNKRAKYGSGLSFRGIDMSRVRTIVSSSFQDTGNLRELGAIDGQVSSDESSVSSANVQGTSAQMDHPSPRQEEEDHRQMEPRDSNSLESVLSAHTYVCNKEGVWVAKALKKHTTGKWGVFSDPITLGRCLVPPSCSHNQVGISLMEAISITPTPQLVTQSIPPFYIVHANRSFSMLSNIGSEDIIGKPLESIFQLREDAADGEEANRGTLKGDQDWIDTACCPPKQCAPQVDCQVRLTPVIDQRPANPRPRSSSRGPVRNPPCIMSHILLQVQTPPGDLINGPNIDSTQKLHVPISSAPAPAPSDATLSTDCLHETIG